MEQIQEMECLREQLREQEKLASLGMLSAGIAHEVQNPLNFVINFCGLSLRLLEDIREMLEEYSGVLPQPISEELKVLAAELADNMNKIKGHGERADSVIRGILQYARGKEDEFVPTGVARLVKEYVWLAYHAVRARYKGLTISIREEYDGDIPEMKLIPQDFSRVVLNLMTNACDAVRMRLAEEGKGYHPEIVISLRKKAEGFVLKIRDNGTGISGEVKEKLFTAFFTTKPPGEGTGLGLSIVRSIVVEKHGGRIDFESEAGTGTVFMVELGARS